MSYAIGEGTLWFTHEGLLHWPICNEGIEAMSTPMGRDEVLAVLDRLCNRQRTEFDGRELEQVSTAVAAIYERCEALERALKGCHANLINARRITEKLAKCVRFCEPYLVGRVASLRRSGGPINNDAAIEVESDLAALREAIAYTGTETSDAEGGGMRRGDGDLLVWVIVATWLMAILFIVLGVKP